MSKIQDLTGQKFNRLTVLSRALSRGKGRKSKVFWNCLCECGKVLECRADSLKNGHTKSCGCWAREDLATRKPAKSGPLHYRWDHTKSNEDRLFLRKNYLPHKEWAKKVKRNYKYKCFICGINKNLVSHHIESYSLNKSLAYEETNGVCLCSSHHKILHQIYGYKTTRRNFYDFYIINYILLQEKIKELTNGT